MPCEDVSDEKKYGEQTLYRHEILNGTIGIIKACPQCPQNLISRETHFGHIGDSCL